MQPVVEQPAPVWPFVGRTEERAELSHALTSAANGRGRMCSLSGEPGIGKTRLCDEIANEAVRLEMRVIWGRCWEAGGAPAYWPWLEVLDALARGLDDDALASALGEGAFMFGELVPSARARIAKHAAADTAGMRSADEARFLLYRSVLGLLRRASEARGALIVIDDLHAADEASLQLLRFVAREVRNLRVLLLATYREIDARWTDSSRRVLGQLCRESTTRELKPLLARETQAWLDAQARELSSDVREKVAARAQGHPLFLTELLRSLSRDPAGEALPSSVRDVIHERLAQVSGDVRAVLELAAAAGDAIDPELLALATGKPVHEIERALEHAGAAGIVRAQGARAFGFAHALIREALELELPAAATSILHAQVARALAARASDTPPDAELAHHFLKAGDLDAAVVHAARAAERAIALFAHDEAIALLSRVLAALEAAGLASNQQQNRAIAATQIALGRAHMRRGDYPAGRTLCTRAAALARELGDAELLAHAALARGLDLTAALVDPDLVALLQSALAALPVGDSPLRVQISARLAAAMQPHPNLMYPIGLAREAIESARRIGDRATLLDALYTGMAAMMDIIDPKERLPLNLEIEKLASDAGDRERLLRTQGRLVFDHMELGELGAADARIDAFERIASEAGARRYLWRVPLFRAMRAMMHGRFEESELQLERARVLGQAAGDPHTERTCVFAREGLLRAAERHDAMIAYEPEARRMRAALYSGAHWQNGGSAFTFSRLEDGASAARYLALVPEDDWPLVHNPPAFAHLGEPLAMCAETPAVEHVYRLLSPAADRFVSWGYTGFVWDGPASRVLALLAARLGRFAEADAHFAHALAALERLEALPYLARTCYEHGRYLIAREPVAARVAIERAHGLAEQLGMPGLLHLCDERLRTLAALTHEEAHERPHEPRAGMPAPARAVLVTFTSEGELWKLAFEGETLHLRDSLGMQYLARLIAAPGRPIHALELAQAKLAPDAELSSALYASDAGEELDPTARAQYRARVQSLREELDDAEAAHDPERAERVRDELTFVAAELSRAVGLGGRTRRAGSAAERARSAVQRRIKSALERIEEASPTLAGVLAKTIKTGTYCEYRPELLDHS